MVIDKARYFDKVNACWMGKNIGGTVGSPMEFCRQINEIDGYTQELDNAMPNDDLDIQLLWLIAMEEMGVHVTTERLGEYWQRYITPHWGEYGISKVNMKYGILPPMSGTSNNPMFKNSNGSFIRSEIWACLAPGRPDVAVSYAVKDAVIDHGDGEGTWGEIFCAALQSAAFVVSDLDTLVAIALSYIPPDCGVTKAVLDAQALVRKGVDKREARTYMLTHYRGNSAVGKGISDEDVAAGFADGVMGYDCPLNVAIVVLGLLYGQDSFDSVVRSTIYFGEDTDCTVGTACSTYGILNGSACIEEKWSAPIGTRIVTGVLNLGELGVYGDILPQTVGEFTERVYRLHARLAGERDVYFADDGGFETGDIPVESLYADPAVLDAFRVEMEHVIFPFDFYTVRVRYEEDCYIKAGRDCPVSVTIRSTYKTADILKVRWLIPEGVTVSPAADGQVYLSQGGFVNCEKTIRFVFNTESPACVNRYVLEMTIEGRTTAMYVPVVLHSGNFL